MKSDSSENAAARKWIYNKGKRRQGFFTCPKTFFTLTSIDFSLHDNDKEEELEEEEEGEEDAGEVQGAYDDGKIFHLTNTSFIRFVTLFASFMAWQLLPPHMSQFFPVSVGIFQQM